MALICLEDFEEEARKKLDRNAWKYYSSGSKRECTTRDNIIAYTRYCIRPLVLRDVSSVDLSTTVLGNKISYPVCVSPTAMQCMAHPDGEKATARACQKMDTCMVLSSWSTTSLEDVTTAVPGGNGLRWFQIQSYYGSESLVKRAEAAGYKALVVTVDNPSIKAGNLVEKKHLTFPSHLTMGNFCIDEAVQSSLGIEEACSQYFSPEATWSFVDWLRSITSLPIVLKGILRADDAREALNHDIQGILVSNHGGRQLDTVPATIDALADIVKEVNGRVEVYVDGGIRHGTDVLKALALRARAVFVGRPVIYGLACNGEEGVYQVLNILKEEVREAFTLSGCRSVTEVQSVRDLVVPKTFYTHPRSKI